MQQTKTKDEKKKTLHQCVVARSYSRLAIRDDLPPSCWAELYIFLDIRVRGGRCYAGWVRIEDRVGSRARVCGRRGQGIVTVCASGTGSASGSGTGFGSSSGRVGVVRAVVMSYQQCDAYHREHQANDDDNQDGDDI